MPHERLVRFPVPCDARSVPVTAVLQFFFRLTPLLRDECTELATLAVACGAESLWGPIWGAEGGGRRVVLGGSFAQINACIVVSTKDALALIPCSYGDIRADVHRV